jgi:hypothetical protein
MIRDALVMVHNAVLVVISNFNEVGPFGLDAEIKTAADGL